MSKHFFISDKCNGGKCDECQEGELRTNGHVVQPRCVCGCHAEKKPASSNTTLKVRNGVLGGSSGFTR